MDIWASCAIDGLGQRSTTHRVSGTRMSMWTFFQTCGFIEAHLVGRDVGPLGDVVGAAHTDVGIHLGHALGFDLGDELHLLIAAGELQGPPDRLGS